ncbi:PilW family protein [Vreelandella subglaciescola]|jgi:prepilin-type N-terminal cleavage/methylation domain-containing protein|uniref:Prepilin-type N-terminal cleavage/methylation domain-containing protein n=1 Tax=Vreelandella subglaciescola TaxID=29571 RepID=A0A1M7GIB3_9GAMM|nr:type II secretion system protein [Halomonas subglaciescola]SHM15868.1 prepilin-type N-terminal cleavage/methylation domain-containing protein [Halomonas subglaciescola]
MISASRQAGFTLIELMVALLVGSLVVLGAGSLFLTTLQTFQTVGELSRKQETVIFAAHTLSAGIRQSKDDGEGMPYTLQCQINKDKDDQCECTLQDIDKNQPLVTFPRSFDGNWSEDDCEENDLLDDKGNVVEISLPLEKNGEAIIFRVAKRQSIVDKYFANGGASPEESQ